MSELNHTKLNQEYLIGIDVGSTTTKLAVVDIENQTLLYQDYQRHHARQQESICSILQSFTDSAVYEKLCRPSASPAKETDAEAVDVSASRAAGGSISRPLEYAGPKFRTAITGSGAKPIADAAGLPFVQEVVANAIAIGALYDEVGTAIELGGQDAKMLFLKRKENEKGSGRLSVSDMRMNGSCAGGTGAFIDEIAGILKTPVEEFDALAAEGRTVYDISGRCGVYAKTDIQPLLNQGVAREDIALSAFHAIAKQTIGGLAQGLTIRRPVIFEGGPLTFNKTLIRVFAERLGLQEDEILIPKSPEMMVAYGAALSLNTLFREQRTGMTLLDLLQRLKAAAPRTTAEENMPSRPFFDSGEEREAFAARHQRPDTKVRRPADPVVRAYLGIDSGSTTSKFVLLDEDGRLIESFYAPNEGEPLRVVRDALVSLHREYQTNGQTLEILAAGSTGYGELLFHRAWNTDVHAVETVAHARAAAAYIDDATFILDIGGQDMKAIWMDHGIITNVVVNEACSSGCGSFLENFAKTLHIPVREIAERAFDAASPAVLGSRCTVFMNSSIITEQRNGRTPDEIMAGLCRSIIENVFTKVIRISNLDSLGERIVVQGGTFENDAVLRAMEQYTGKEVLRAPYPGLMGAIGAALLTREEAERKKAAEGSFATRFPDFAALEAFHWEQATDLPCPFCTNHCKRTVLHFSNGASFVTNNRCERGEILGDGRDPAARDQIRKLQQKKDAVPNLYRLREELLFRDYPYTRLCEEKEVTIGLPRVLFNWEYMPFWTTFWRALGYKVLMSPMSTRPIYESGLSAVTSDTVCFPAKLVHGHLRALHRMHVDRIFMPSVTVVHSENHEASSESMCAVVKGYPIVVRNSDNPEDQWGIPFDAPLFHWHQEADMIRQLCRYMKDTFDTDPTLTKKAVGQALSAMQSFHEALQSEGARVLADCRAAGRYAVVLASRPYQNDPLVNHDLPEMLCAMGIPVLTADAVPGIRDVDLKKSRLDIVNNFHARMLGSAMVAAADPALEYIQIVSFGCGHDAYLSDEIIRLMREISGKAPLILKLDESDIQGPLRIRVRSFIETVEMRKKQGMMLKVHALSDPYPVKLSKKDAKEKVILVPNTSHAFCEVMSSAMATQHLKTTPLPIGREKAIEYGKKYVHNDICFPAQIVIGEIIAALKTGAYDPDNTGVAMGKYVGDCRLTHYAALLRKALDEAGFEKVPILTNDAADTRNQHPGYHMNLLSSIRLAYALPVIDALEEILRKIRPYETEKGSADRAFDRALREVSDALRTGGIRAMKAAFQKSIDLLDNVRCDFAKKKPRVLIVGEYLLNFHPGANHEIERYLEDNGFEIIEARMTEVIRKTYFCKDTEAREYHVQKPLAEKAFNRLANRIFEAAQDMTDRIASKSPFYQKPTRMEELAKESDPIIHHTFDAGEGILIPGEILHHARLGCRNFIILQPFGCLPNHVVGRGITKKLKELYPDAHILPLDYDPDVSTANIENRLQMMITNTKLEQAG